MWRWQAWRWRRQIKPIHAVIETGARTGGTVVERANRAALVGSMGRERVGEKKESGQNRQAVRWSAVGQRAADESSCSFQRFHFPLVDFLQFWSPAVSSGRVHARACWRAGQSPTDLTGPGRARHKALWIAQTLPVATRTVCGGQRDKQLLDSELRNGTVGALATLHCTVHLS